MPTKFWIQHGDVVKLKDGRLGTVKFIGVVRPSPEQVENEKNGERGKPKRLHVSYGLEMDEQFEGGNSGSIDKKQYFPCDEGHGLFVTRDMIVENKHAQHKPGSRLNSTRRRIRAAYSRPVHSPQGRPMHGQFPSSVSFQESVPGIAMQGVPNKARASTEFGPNQTPSSPSAFSIGEPADAVSKVSFLSAKMRKMLQEKFGADVEGDKDIASLLQQIETMAVGNGQARLASLKIVTPTDDGDGDSEGDDEEGNEGADMVGELISPNMLSPLVNNWDYATNLDFLSPHRSEDDGKDPMMEMGKIFTGELDLNKDPMASMGLVEFQANMVTRSRKRSRQMSATLESLPSVTSMMASARTHTRSSSGTRRGSLINLRRHSTNPNMHRKHFSVPAVKMGVVTQMDQLASDDEPEDENIEDEDQSPAQLERQRSHRAKLNERTTTIDVLDKQLREKTNEMNALQNKSITLLTEDGGDGEDADDGGFERNYYKIEVQLARLAVEKRELLDQHDEAMRLLQEDMLENVFDDPVVPEQPKDEEEPKVEQEKPSGLRGQVISDLGIDLVKDLNIGVDEILDLVKRRQV